MIIDVHAHMGWDQVFDEEFTAQDLLAKHKLFGISRTIVQPASCHTLESVQKQHTAIAELAKKHPGEFQGMANPNPHLPDAEYEAELKRCVLELGFVGVKIHTFAHSVVPGGRDGRKVFRLAQQLKIPVMVHTGPGIPFANPSLLIPVARDFPDVTVVMAHCGLMISAAEVPIVLDLCPNVVADVTWTGAFLVRHWVHQFGAQRFMYGSDHADNAGTELAKVRECGLTDEQENLLLSGNAIRVYGGL
jgi:predicted TIM-barrel fold metal-dependent hydrolase